jgi:protein-disulfide isomerase
VYGDQVRIVFKHQVLATHPKAPAAHAAAEAAHRQGRFWEMHDRIFANQREMSPEKYEEYAAEIGLDLEQYKRDIVSQEVKSRIDADTREAEKVGNRGTPGFFINGRLLRGAKPFESFKTIIDEELAGKKVS